MNNNYELGKVIVALNINITSKDVLDYYIDLVLDGIDYEKAEIIFHSKNTESLNEGTNIVLIYLKDKNPHAVTNAVAKLSSSPYIVYAEPDYIEEMHIISNDPLYNQLWGIQKINAPLAWDYTTLISMMAYLLLRLEMMELTMMLIQCIQHHMIVKILFL